MRLNGVPPTANLVKWGPHKVAQLLLHHLFHLLQIGKFPNNGPDHEEYALVWLIIIGNHQVLLERHIAPPPTPLGEFKYEVLVAKRDNILVEKEKPYVFGKVQNMELVQHVLGEDGEGLLWVTNKRNNVVNHRVSQTTCTFCSKKVKIER